MTFIFVTSGSQGPGFTLPAKTKNSFSVNVFCILSIYVSVKIQYNIKYMNLHVLYEYLNKACYLLMAFATDIAPAAEGIVRPNLPYYSDTTEHASMCQATICQILINSTPFYPVSALQKTNPNHPPQNPKQNKKSKQTKKPTHQTTNPKIPNKNPTAVIQCLLTSRHTIHSICFCSHP